MPTTKKRINISTSKVTESILKMIAKRDRVPVATKAAELLEIALELEEDMALGALAEERMAKKEKMIPHHLAWK